MPRLQALLCKLEAAQVPAEPQDVQEIHQMRLSELVVMHLEVPQMQECEVLQITQVQPDTASGLADALEVRR